RNSAVVVIDLLLRRQDEIGRDDRNAVRALFLGHLRQAHSLARRLRSRTSKHRHSAMHMLDGRGDDHLLFCLVEGVELAISAEHQNTVYASANEVVEKPA